MLKLRYMFENYELAKFALQNWEHDTESLTEYLKYFRISSNAVYPFAMNGERHFLRLSPVEEKMEQNVKGELAFLQYLKEAGYPSVAPVPAKNGEILLTLCSKWGKYYASVFAGVAGVPIEETDYTAEIMVSYGKALGWLHRLSMNYVSDCSKWSYEDVLVWIQDMLVTYRAPESMLTEVAEVKKELALLTKNSETFGLVHYDFEADNVFYNEKDRSCHVIDFEDGMYHFFLVDIEQVFDCLSEELDDAAFCKAKEFFLQGYCGEKVLEDDFEEKLLLMRRFCNLYSYARLIRCIAEEVPNEPQWMNNLKKHLVYRVKQLENNINPEKLLFAKLSSENFHVNSLDDFVRHQEVKECWRKRDDNYVLVPYEFVEDWDVEKCREVAQTIINGMNDAGFAYGAFLKNKVIGYIYLCKRLFGSEKQYIELQLFHVSEPFRKIGIGKELFRLACVEAKMIGAKKIYISAHSSKESQEAYHRLGCVPAVEINQEITESEPLDIQMEYQLQQ